MNSCISIDMDNYREYRSLLDPEGGHDGESFYLDAVPRFLDILDRAGARATFFAIGRDVRVEAHRSVLREIASRGHEVGNHSYTHPYNFRALSISQREEEIRQAEEAIADVIGERPVGFRTPSADVDGDTLEVLAERGYLYDSSVMPSPLMLAFMLYGKLFIRHQNYQLGPPGVVIAPSDPYHPDRRRVYRRHSQSDGDPGLGLVEMPFSLIPFVRFPFYSTLLRIFGRRFFDLCTRFYNRDRPMLHFLFHLIDLADLEGTELGSKLESTPGLAVSVERRRRFVAHVVEVLAIEGEAVPLRDVAEKFLREAAQA